MLHCRFCLAVIYFSDCVQCLPALTSTSGSGQQYTAILCTVWLVRDGGKERETGGRLGKDIKRREWKFTEYVNSWENGRLLVELD